MILKLPLIILAFLLVLTPSKSQSNYFNIYCGYPITYEVGAAFSTTVSPGMLWFGYNSQVILNSSWTDKNFSVMGAGSSNFWASYKVFDSDTCGGQLNQVLTHNGISAVETNASNGIRYAVAGTYNKAVYFAGLSAQGAVLHTKCYQFPREDGFLFNHAGKPIIIEAEHPNTYYICGSYRSNMYILKIDHVGNIIWSHYYRLMNNTKPKDLILDPVNTGGLIVVGSTMLNIFDTDAFFMNVRTDNGSVAGCKLYGRDFLDDSFNTIAVSHDPVTNQTNGLTVGGYQQPLSPRFPSAWLIKFNTTGNVAWSNGIFTTTGVNKGYTDVVERLNTNGDYEYYGLLNSNAGMQVTKHNDNGMPFVATSQTNQFATNVAQNNEFTYEIPGFLSLPSRGTSLSYVNTAVSGGADIGIQVYGTTFWNTGFSGSYAVNAYFNGETGCFKSLNVLPQSEYLAFETTPLNVMVYDHFTACNNFDVQAYFQGGAMTILCSGSQSSGSNQRQQQSEEVTEAPSLNNLPLSEIGVYPNPSSGRTYVNFKMEEKGDIKLDVYDLVGNLVYTTEKHIDEKGTHREDVDFAQLQLSDGVYLLTLTVNNEGIYKEKIIYKK